MSWRISFMTVFLALLLTPGLGLAVTLTCPKQDITVTAPDIALVDKVCSVAAASQSLLASCNLKQKEPYSIAVSNRLAPEFDDCYGIYKCDDNVVEVLTPNALLEAIQRTGNFQNLPADVLFDSLLVHEISHVLTYQSDMGPPQSRPEVEYVAYVMQLESLPKAARDIFLQAHPVTQPVSLITLNDIILAMSPEVFAAKAWTHFRAEGNGCDFIRSVLAQEVRFPTSIDGPQ